MSGQDGSTWDLAVPRRPGVDDYNDCAKEDDAAFPANPLTMPTAPEYNELCAHDVVYGRMTPNATISIASGATPSVLDFTAAPSDVVLATFAVTRNAAGDVSITWPANTFPPALTRPKAFLNNGPGMIWADNITNGVRVKTYDKGGALTDTDFTVDVM